MKVEQGINLHRKSMTISVIAVCMSLIPVVSARAESTPTIIPINVWNALVNGATRTLDGKIVFPKSRDNLNISINNQFTTTDVQDVNDFVKEVASVCPSYTPKVSSNDNSAKIQMNIVPKSEFPRYIPEVEINDDSAFYWYYYRDSLSLAEAKAVIDSGLAGDSRSREIKYQLLYSLGILGGEISPIFDGNKFTTLGRDVMHVYCSNLIQPGALLSDVARDFDSNYLAASGAKPTIKPEVITDSLDAEMLVILGDAHKQFAERVLGLEWTIQSGSKTIASGYFDNSKNVLNPNFTISLSNLNLSSGLYGLNLRFKSSSRKEGLITTEVYGDFHKSTFYIRSNTDNKRKTIICIKGKTSKKVTGRNPKCPKGWKRKK